MRAILKFLVVALSLILVLLIATCVFLFSEPNDPPQPPSGSSPVTGTPTDPSTAPKEYTVTFQIGGKTHTQTVLGGHYPDAVSTDIPGLRFVSWRNDAGEAVDPASVAIQGDTTYTAEMYPVLKQHTPYLFVDSKGYLHPDDALTGDDLRRGLTALATEEALSYYPELPSGTNAVTVSELTSLLCALFEEERVAAALTGAAENSVTRAMFASAMHALLGYDHNETVVLADGVTVPLDLTGDRTDTLTLMQASMAHTPDESGTAWTEFALPTTYEPGFLNIDGYLYYVQENHFFLRNGKVGELTFGSDGRYTCGDTGLDAMVAEVIKLYTDAEPNADRLTLLRRVFDHCVNEYKYGNRWDPDQLPHPAYGEKGWEIPRAKKMMDRKWGNCYYFAAAFWALSRGLGYEAEAVSGTCLKDKQPHSWCFIEIDGKDYIFDTEWQWSYINRQNKPHMDMFMIPKTGGAYPWSYWNYRWE